MTFKWYAVMFLITAVIWAILDTVVYFTTGRPGILVTWLPGVAYGLLMAWIDHNGGGE